VTYSLHSHRSVSSGPGTLRRARLVELGGAPLSAVGAGWLERNPLGVRSETEAALELDGRRIHRFLAVPM